MTELEKMEARYNGRWQGLGFKLYSGEFKIIDMRAEWYCPRCVTERLLLSDDGHSLYCPTHYSVCEYSYEDAIARERDQVVWSERYEHPLNPRESIERQIRIKRNAISAAHSRIIQLDEGIKQTEAEIKELEAKLSTTSTKDHK